MTEGEITKICCLLLSLPQSFFKRKMTAPSSEGACVCAIFSICYIPKAIINTLISSAAASHRPTTSSFASYCSQQPLGCLSLTMHLLLFRKNHARLACSVVNALTTARCRYQLLRFADRGKPCPYGCAFILISFQP